MRATTADLAGNCTMEREALVLDGLTMALAAKNSGGFVIAQVERIAETGSLHPRDVKIPGILVDCVRRRRAGTAPANLFHRLFARLCPPVSRRHGADCALPLDPRKVIARRAALELPAGGVVNLGIGMPEGVASVANEEQVLRYVTLTSEGGAIGGMPAAGLDFGATVNPDAIIEQNQQFVFYRRRWARHGLSRHGPGRRVRQCERVALRRSAGRGGRFHQYLAECPPRGLCRYLHASGLDVAFEHGGIRIVKEGRSPKFVEAVDQITFAGELARQEGRRATYITERCVLQLTPRGMELTEVAGGVDIERDILSQMGFRPLVEEPREMDARLFRPEPMEIAADFTRLRLEDRVVYDDGTNTLFLNFAGLRVRDEADVEAIREAVLARIGALGRKVNTVVNYDAVVVDDDVVDAYAALADELTKKHYASVSRYTTSAFMSLNLGGRAARAGCAGAHLRKLGRSARAGQIGRRGGLDRPALASVIVTLFSSRRRVARQEGRCFGARDTDRTVCFIPYMRCSRPRWRRCALSPI